MNKNKKTSEYIVGENAVLQDTWAIYFLITNLHDM